MGSSWINGMSTKRDRGQCGHRLKQSKGFARFKHDKSVLIL